MALTTAFARNGNRKAVPQTTADGSVSYEQGFGNLYALPPEEGGLFIDRAQFNQIMYDTTSAVISNQNSINTLNTKVANIESGVATGVVNLTTNQTIGGVKTFSVPPVSATNPANNNQVANKAYVDSVASTKANKNATVNLTGDQNIAGVKTFTDNISSPNLNLLQTQINGLVANGKYPLLMQNTVLNITAGDGGDFSTITDALIYAKQTQSKLINAVTKVTLLSDFSDDLFLNGYPLVYIDCNGFKLANKFTVNHSRVLFNKLKLSGNLDTVSSIVYLYNGATIGGISSETPGAGSCIVSNSSTIIVAGNVNFSPNENQYGIFSKGASRVYLLAGSSFTQTVGTYFLSVISGGLISADDNINIGGVSVTKTNIAANTITANGIIFGNMWS
jgi:hypothetical protein